MTRKEIEKRCREEMQQNIPNKDALWAKIEGSLPEQKPVIQQKTGGTQFHMLYRAMAAAACFLFVAAGASLWRMQQRLETSESENTMRLESDNSSDAEYDHDGDADAVDNDGDDADYDGDADMDYDFSGDEPANNAASDAAPKAEHSDFEKPLRYSDLYVAPEGSFSVETELLHTDGEYFQETDVLSQTDCFVDVLVGDGWQDSETGKINYELIIMDVYGDVQIPDISLRISSDSPYLLGIGHEYVLPLRQTGERGYGIDWELSYTCAPQIERTNDDKILFHSGWYSLMTEESVPVLCDSNGVDDYFYDRMYLTGYTELEAFLYEWEYGAL